MNNMENNLDMSLREVLKILQERIMKSSHWLGTKALMSPTDFWVYQELIFENKPDIIIEIGNRFGGGLLAFAHIQDILKRSTDSIIIGVDINHHQVSDDVRNHERIRLIEGDACKSFSLVKALVDKTPHERIMIIEDSSHTYQNTLNVLNTYSSLVTKGNYFIVEDSICWHGLDIGPNPGPYEAIEAFAASNNDFEIDRSKEDFLITWNPKGFLKKIT
tara:strand:- start:1243 stop:1896 length:654 start_codon:yes stop_codon:yes gene_type:complete